MVCCLGRPINLGLSHVLRGIFLLIHDKAIILEDLGEGLEGVLHLQVSSITFVLNPYYFSNITWFVSLTWMPLVIHLSTLCKVMVE